MKEGMRKIEKKNAFKDIYTKLLTMVFLGMGYRPWVWGDRREF